MVYLHFVDKHSMSPKKKMKHDDSTVDTGTHNMSSKKKKRHVSTTDTVPQKPANIGTDTFFKLISSGAVAKPLVTVTATVTVRSANFRSASIS